MTEGNPREHVLGDFIKSTATCKRVPVAVIPACFWRESMRAIPQARLRGHDAREPVSSLRDALPGGELPWRNQMTDHVQPRGKGPEELTAITKAYDLVREITQRVAKFPRDHKFILGDRMLSNGYDVLDLLIEAKYTQAKRGMLERANLRLEQMRFQLRLAHDMKLMSTRQYEVGSRLVDEVGRLVGGWARALRSGAN
jgi:hypothetical protein